MGFRKTIVGIALFSLAGAGVAALAQDATPETADTSRVRVIAPYSLLTDLTEAQISKIKVIHEAELAQVKALETKEHTDILAVLSDAQKKELDLAIAKAAADKKATAEERRAKELQDKAAQLRAAATQPAGK